MLGMLRTFRRSGPTAALVSWAAGLFAFWFTNYGLDGVELQIQIVSPVATSLVLYVLVGLLKPEDTPERDAVLDRINTDAPEDAPAPAVQPRG
jgi:hypothetical protein